MPGGTIDLLRVAESASPDIAGQIDLKISTSFSSIVLRMRLAGGARLDKTAIVDDDDAGTFHFEFSEGDIPEGIHYADILLFDLTTPTDSLGVPAGSPLRIVARSRQ